MTDFPNQSKGAAQPEPLAVTLLRELKFARGLLLGKDMRSDAIDDAIALAEKQGVVS